MSRFPVRCIGVLMLAASLVPASAWAQGKPTGGTATGGNTGGGTAPPPTTGNNPPVRTIPTIPNPTQPEFNRPIFLSGKVVLDRGIPITQPIPVERVCNGTIRREGYTDTKGNFSIMLGDNNTFQDASESGGFTSRTGMNSINPRTLWNCEIRAVLPGYTSSSVILAGRDFNGNPDIGTITLTRAGGGGEGDSISVVSLKAPDKARKEFEKGREDFANKKYENSEKHLAKAVEIYPEYALAWQLRGQGQEQLKQDEEAVKSYQSAISSDPKFVPPYIRLALLEASKANWAEVARLTQRAVELDPTNYPDAHFLNGAAHFNLKQYPEAEKSALKAVALDKDHRFPRSELLLGTIFQMKGLNAAAAEHLKTYLKLEPKSPEAARIQTYLASVDQQNASAQPTPKPQP